MIPYQEQEGKLSKEDCDLTSSSKLFNIEPACIITITQLLYSIMFNL